MEKVRPWWGQPSDRGRLKIRTAVAVVGFVSVAKRPPLSTTRFDSCHAVHGEFGICSFWKEVPHEKSVCVCLSVCTFVCVCE